MPSIPAKSATTPAKPTAPAAAKGAKPPSVPQLITPPLFRPIDWFTLLVTAVVLFIGYYLTISPDLTLEDSGELAVGSFYAGVPHPPGYPVWTVFTWFFTQILPFHNIAWRVSVASAFSASLACGFLALMVSRGSSMIIESIEELKGINPRWENAMCMVSGFVAALLLGFNGFMWSQAVIVEVYPFSVLSMVIMMSCLLRWMYAPHQRRFLYWAAFLFGICLTNHQTLVVAAMGVEVLIIAADAKLGRDLMVINVLCWILGLFLSSIHFIQTFDSGPGETNMVFVIFQIVGFASLGTLIWLLIRSKFEDMADVFYMILPAGVLGVAVACKSPFLVVLAILAILAGYIFWKPLQERRTVPIMALLCGVGAAFYFYMPLASMSNPPMNWGYPRTVEGFFHALSRGQYEKTHPTDFIHDPMRLWNQTIQYFTGAGDEFSFAYLLLALVPFLFYFRMQKRERAWMTGLFGIYFCLAFLLMVLLNISPDRQTAQLVKVFFTASYVPVAMWIGYGLTLTAAWLVTNYERTRFWVLIGGAVSFAISLFTLTETIKSTFEVPGAAGALSGVHAFQYAMQHLVERGLGSLPIWGAMMVSALVLVFLLVVFLFRKQVKLGVILVLFTLMPVGMIISHWADNEQRDHLFGFYFGHDMFTPPFVGPDGNFSYDPAVRAQVMKDPAKARLAYPEMDRDTVLFGGTDPGRFCPTYMIFDESFIPADCRRDHNFDRRDVYLITQNALADNTYLSYIRAHYNRSEQIDPPFFQNFLPEKIPAVFHGPTGWLMPLDNIFEGLGAKIEKERRTATSFFAESHFKNVSALAAKLRKGDQQDTLAKFLYDKLTPETKSLLDNKGDDKAVAKALAKDFNVILESGSIYSPERFKNVKLPILIAEAGQQNVGLTTTASTNTTIRVNRRMLEEAYPEIERSLGGVFPDTEIHTPSPEESQQCFQEYLADAQKRLENHQIKPGEDVHIEGGRVQVSGQVAVMSINGLLTKVIFDRNPNHEFYVEESFPLDWMYPYLTPFGNIMQIHRQPLAEMPQDVIDRDHAFWSKYSERMIGNWITYDTPIQDICKFAEKIYLHHDYSNFKGDPKFIRDDNGQKAFSKLRSSIGGIYKWRFENQLNPAERARVLKEAEFTFKQAFAFCPYSPEALFRYVQLLLSPGVGRLDDALLLANTCLKLDPYNTQVQSLIAQLEANRKASGPVSIQSIFNQVQQLQTQGKMEEADQLLNQILTSQTDPTILFMTGELYVKMNRYAKGEEAMQKLVRVAPEPAENWYNLATIQAVQGKAADAAATLKKAFQLNEQQMKANPKAASLRDHIATDRNFDPIRATAEFHAATNKS